MADAPLRRIERRREAGDPTAEVEHLRGRVRAGRLAPARLELAARLGHGPALDALGWPAEELKEPADPPAWLRSLLVAIDAPVVVRALHAAVEAALTGELAPLEARRLRAVEGWLDEPGPLAADRALRVAHTTGPSLDPGRDDATAYLAETAWIAERLERPLADEVSLADLVRRVDAALEACAQLGASAGDLREAMRATLIAWAVDESRG